MADQELSDSSSVMTEGDYEMVQLEVRNGSVRYETTNSVTVASTLDELPPYRIVKGLVETSHAEMRVSAWHQIEDILDELIAQRFKATGTSDCWNYTKLCEPAHGCLAGDGVLAYGKDLLIRGEIGGLHPEYPDIFSVSSTQNSGFVTLKKDSKYLIHGASTKRVVQLINMPRTSIFARFGLKYCPRLILADLPVTVQSRTGAFMGQYAMSPSTASPVGDFSMIDRRGRKLTTYFPSPSLPKLDVEITSSADLVVSPCLKPKEKFIVCNKDGYVQCLSIFGVEATAIDILCHAPLADVKVEHNGTALFYEKNGLAYKDGVPFRNERELQKWFISLGPGLCFNSYSGLLGNLSLLNNRVRFMTSIEPTSRISCPARKFRVA